MNPKEMPEIVSVIIPLYNRSELIDETLASLAAQIFSEIEVIVIDDGSTDDSAEQARLGLSRHGLRGRVVTIENSGPDAARDYGVGLAQGSLLGFLDSDDSYLPEFLAEMVATFARFPETEWAFADFFVTDAKLNVVSRKSQDLKRFASTFGSAEEGTLVLSGGRFFEYLLQEQPIFPSALMVRRSLYDRVGPFTKLIPQRILSLEWEFMLRAAKVASAAYLSKPLVKIRKHEGNISGVLVKQDEGEIAVLKVVELGYQLSSGERGVVRRELARRGWEVGYHYYLHQDAERARAWFLDSLTSRWSLKSSLYLALTLLPAHVQRLLRQMNRSLKGVA